MMSTGITVLEPINYLVVGHLTQDITPAGLMMGGTVTYSALTAQALGYKVGIVTSARPDIDLSPLKDIPVQVIPADNSTTFKNLDTPSGRIQYLFHTAKNLTASDLPYQWLATPIIHIGPVAMEISPNIIDSLPASSFIGITPQGWMRKWDSEGRVSPGAWENAEHLLTKASAVIISIEDVQGDESVIAEMIEQTSILVVTEANLGARLYWNGDYRHFSPPNEIEIDATGAGDIFAASFFTRMYETRDPWESARFATLIASRSIARIGLNSVPTADEVAASRISITGIC
jgi:sugar/nucleoside kinase (ribokinase family)